MPAKKVPKEAEEPEIEETEDTEEPTEELEDAKTTKEENVKGSPLPKPVRDELKVVIIIKANRIMVGAQSPNCDPVYKTSEGSLADALQMIPTLVSEANLKWDANPRYPKADLPAPAPSPTLARATTTSPPAKPKAQPSFF